MDLQIVSVRDIVADCYSQPNFVLSVGAAVRSFGDGINGKEGPFVDHPDHFELFHLGVYHDHNASFELFPNPRQVAVGANLKR